MAPVTRVASLAGSVTVLWVLLIVTAPLAPLPVALVAYGLGSVICHQIAERSFHLLNTQLPVCARCTGIYVGAAIGSLALWLVARRGGGLRPRHQHLSFERLLLLVALGATATSVLLEWVGVWAPSNLARAALGFPLGGTIAWIVVRTMSTSLSVATAP